MTGRDQPPPDQPPPADGPRLAPGGVADGPALSPRRTRKPWWLRLLGGLAALVIAAVLIVVIGIDTGPGHRFLADQIAQQSPKSGLRIRIGRIDGSVWSTVRLRDVRLYDPKGQFLDVPEARMDWTPALWLNNTLRINQLIIPDLHLIRKPALVPSTRKSPILPGFDIDIRDLQIDRARIDAAVTGGKPQIARVDGRVRARKGELDVALDVASTARDKAKIVLTAVPDANRFDADVRITAPAHGVIGGLLGTHRPFDATIRGDGDFKSWKGTAEATMEGREALRLAIDNRNGRIGLHGMAAPAPFLSGKLQRLSSPRIAIDGNGELTGRTIDGALQLRSDALDIRAEGAVDLTNNRFRQVLINGRLLHPPALFPNMRGRDIRLAVRLDGDFARASFDYLLTAPQVSFDTTGFEQVRIAGQGRLSPAPVIVPLHLTAARVTGAGTEAGNILRNLRVDGQVRVTAAQIAGDHLQVRSDQLQGQAAVLIDLATGRYDVSLNGGLKRYLIPGLGLIEVVTELKVLPDASGQGSHVGGRARVRFLRFDNAFLRELAGGLPMIDSGFSRGRDGVMRFDGLVLKAPAVTIRGNGIRRRDGTFQFEGAGNHRQYGAFRLVLDGPIGRPRIALLLAAPNAAAGLRDVHLQLDPDPAGYRFTTNGQSTLGPFTGTGTILMGGRGGQTRIRIDRLVVTDTTLAGMLTVVPGGLAGALSVDGGGVNGALVLAMKGGLQQVAADLRASRARFAGDPPIAIRSGRVQGTILLRPGNPAIDATFTALGLQRGGVRLARLAGNVTMEGDRGVLKASFAGSRGRSFEMQTVASFTASRWEVALQGMIDRRPLRLDAPAVLTRTAEGWALAPTGLSFAGGHASLTGLFGEGRANVDGRLDRLPLSILNIVQPKLGLGGVATGTFRFSRAGASALPSADLNLQIKGMTRSGLILSSRPVNAGINMALRPDGLSARAIVAGQDGAVIGRAQARIAPIGGGDGLADRLSRAPLFAQIRYNGASDTLWRLTGVETIDLSGPIAIGADVTGTAAQPVIRGLMRTSQLRLESAVSGTVIQNIQANGHFDGSRLTIPSFTGAASNGGAVTGSATFDISATTGLAMNINANLDKAEILDRDDLGATVTGPLSIRSDGQSGVIGGTLELIRSRYRLGRATAGRVPQLNVRERNGADPIEVAPPRPAPPWSYDIKAHAANRLMVTGLGLDSEWRATLAISGRVDNPVIEGNARLLRGGYEFAGRRFDLDKGEIRFTGSVPADPVLDIAASAKMNDVDATIRVTGTGLKPDISFVSTPALPEDELLSRLLFGTSITNLSAPEALQLAAAVASLNSAGGGVDLNPINAVRKAAGLDRLRILPADVATGAGTSLAAGKYIGRRTFVEVISDGQGYSATRVEFQITRWLSLLSSISTIGRQSANVRISKDY